MLSFAPTALRFAVIVVAAALVAAACSGSTSGEAGDSEDPGVYPDGGRQRQKDRGRAGEGTGGPDLGAVELDLRPVLDGLAMPVLVTTAGDGDDRLFIVEQGGTIRVARQGRVRPEPFLDITDLTTAGGEQGLLGLAFHPAYERNGRFFINYTDVSGDTVVAEYTAPSSSETADPRSAKALLTIGQPYSNHNGGHLAFGPDGYLYIGTGDGGSAGDPQDNAQSLETLLGKLLRIDVDMSSGGVPYGIPTDNPFSGRASSRPEIWAYGLRNPWRFSFDRDTDDLWIGDVGQDSVEEIDHVSSRKAGLNFGWDDMEGTRCFEPPSGCDADGRVLPVTEYSHDEGCSVTGGFVYRGSGFPQLEGIYFFADYCSGAIYGISADAQALDPARLEAGGSQVSSFGEDERGELYVVDGPGGRVLQVTARP